MTAVADTIGMRSGVTGTMGVSSAVYDPANLKVMKKQMTGSRSKKAFTVTLIY